MSSLHGDLLRHIKICEAKERFIDELKSSGIDYCIIRPSGFFSDMNDFINMAKKGRIFLFGDGLVKISPIHGEDLAKVCIDAIKSQNKEIVVGGPDTFTHYEIAELAFSAIGSPCKITRVPDWVRRSLLKILKVIMGSKKFGPIEFFLTVLAVDMSAKNYGQHSLKEFFSASNQKTPY